MPMIKAEIEKLRQVEEAARAGGGQKRIDEQHAKGKLTARERIENLLDPGTFVEIALLGLHQCTDFGMEKNRPWAERSSSGKWERLTWKIISSLPRRTLRSSSSRTSTGMKQSIP